MPIINEPIQRHASKLKWHLATNRVQDRDDELDMVIAAIINSNMTLEDISAKAQSLSYSLSPYTLVNWLYGRVNKPRNNSINAAMYAMGYVNKWSKPHKSRNKLN